MKERIDIKIHRDHPGLRRVVVFTRSQLDAFVCTCGEPGCDGSLVQLSSPCGHPVTAFYSKQHGALVLACPTCSCGSAVRVAGEG